MTDVWVRLSPEEISEAMHGHAAIFGSPSPRDRLRRSFYDKLKAALHKDRSHRLLGDGFTDERGHILDLIEGPIDAVTRIFTVQGAVRGNHFHRHTTQWTYVLSGSLLVAHGDTETTIGPGELAVDKPGVPHAGKALEDTDVLVFTCGPRAGSEYESDTVRLDVPLIEPPSLLDGDWGTLARVEWENWRLQDDRAP
jgi:quercetin dioxygenase-like cupin family protein